MKHLSSLALCGCLCLTGLACVPPSATDGNGGSKGTGGGAGHGGSSTKGGAGGSGGTVASGGAGSGGATGDGSGGKGSGGAAGDGSGGKGNGGAAGAGGGSGGKGGAGTGGTTGGGGKGGGAGAGLGGGMGSSSGSSPGDASGNCTFSQQGAQSSAIQTVGVVTWSTTHPSVTSAHIDFGLTTSYGMTAPVDLTAKDYRTLLLGMKQNKTYNYRITATNSSGDCQSPNYTIDTGSVLTGLPTIKINNKSTASPLFGGFLITGQYVQSPSGNKSPVYILDGDGEYVWAVKVTTDVTGAAMSYDGNYMWINAANVPGPNGQSVHRVAMDGTGDQDLSSKFTGLNHQLTVLPDETVAFYAYNSSAGCDDIKEYNPTTGNVTTIINAGAAEGSGVTACHCNNVQYSNFDGKENALVFSDLDNQVVVKVSRDTKKVIWVLNGGTKSTFSGFTWAGGEHGLHLLAIDRLLVFNNNSKNFSMGGGSSTTAGTGDGSIALEVQLDLTGKKASSPWSYKSSVQNDVMGDVQRLSNGNTIVAYSTKGVVQEVSSSKTLLQELDWPAGGAFGYIEKRATLYGPRPR